MVKEQKFSDWVIWEGHWWGDIWVGPLRSQGTFWIASERTLILERRANAKAREQKKKKEQMFVCFATGAHSNRAGVTRMLKVTKSDER